MAPSNSVLQPSRMRSSTHHKSQDSFIDSGFIDHAHVQVHDQPLTASTSSSNTLHACILSPTGMHSQNHSNHHNFDYHHQRMSDLYTYNNNNSMYHATRTTSLIKEKDLSHATCSSPTSGGCEGVSSSSSRINMHDSRKDIDTKKSRDPIDSRMTIIDETCMTAVMASKDSKIRKRKRTWFIQQQEQQHLKSERLTSTLACSNGIYMKNNNYQFHKNGNNKRNSECLEQSQQQYSDTTTGCDLHGKIYAFERPLFSKSCNFVKNYYVLHPEKNINNVHKENLTSFKEKHVVPNTCDGKTQKPNTPNHAESHRNISPSNSTLVFLYLEEELSSLVPFPSKPIQSLLETSTRRFQSDYTTPCLSLCLNAPFHSTDDISNINNNREEDDSCTRKTTCNNHTSGSSSFSNLEQLDNQHVQQVINRCYEMIQLSTTPNKTFH
ncbi:hypothetical protein C9374_003613 [Naegleria lovaniensis]|uniref:Uncharacterized protein n=1 Tax=Naegleria lovaniensis TaxID=51637 RepID=A0AA88KSN6_NAELO|nr:uncharacterized protein C9374_003613 [Naegleria lovaniensis]KAG2393849.1 hypothetical protein C9374_003613 [Naegleria lovaniensis]